MATKITGKWRFTKGNDGKVKMSKAPRNLSVSDRLKQKTSKRVKVSRRTV